MTDPTGSTSRVFSGVSGLMWSNRASSALASLTAWLVFSSSRLISLMATSARSTSTCVAVAPR